MFAKECPAIFEHDPETNNLSLRPDAFPPWIRKVEGHGFSGVKDRTKTWLYCSDLSLRTHCSGKLFGSMAPEHAPLCTVHSPCHRIASSRYSGLDCKNRWCPDTPQRPKAHIPFRDRASQLNLRPHKRPPIGTTETTLASDQNTQPEPEPEEAEAALDECGGGDVAPPMEDAVEDSDEDAVLLPTEEDTVPEEPPEVEYPTMEQYKARWAEKLAAHSRAQATKPFSLATLVPKPLPALWQDCKGLSVSTTCACTLLGSPLCATMDGAKALTYLSTNSAAKRPSRGYAFVGLSRRFSHLLSSTACLVTVTGSRL